MEHLARRGATAAVAALAVGGLVAVLTPTNQSLPDVQIRDFGLAAANIDAQPAVDIVENHVRPDMIGGGGYDDQHINLGDLLLGQGDTELGEGADFNLGDLDENALNALLGGSLDPQALAGVIPPDFDFSGIAPPTVGGAFSGAEQAAGAAAASAVTGIALAMQGLPAAYDALTTAVAAIEADLNSTLVEAQTAAAERLFGDNSDVIDVVNWIYSVNNTLLANTQSAFNNLFGIPFDAHASLLGHLDPDLADADWSVVLGLSPDELNDIINAIQADNMSLLGSIDWAAWFASLF